MNVYVVSCANILMTMGLLCLGGCCYVCIFGLFSRRRYRAVSKWCFRICTVLVAGGPVAYFFTTYLCTPRKMFRVATSDV